MISENLLLQFGADLIEYRAHERIFNENNKALFYFQIKTGSVKMFNLNEAGKEFVQGMFSDGESFGEPPLFGDFDYPAAAETIQKTTLYRLSKDNFTSLLKEHFDAHLALTAKLSQRLSYKSMIMKEISVHSPEHRILTLVDFLKEREPTNESFLVPLTRQQIANLTGLRVETVIRAFKHLEEDGEIQIINRKIYR